MAEEESEGEEPKHFASAKARRSRYHRKSSVLRSLKSQFKARLDDDESQMPDADVDADSNKNSDDDGNNSLEEINNGNRFMPNNFRRHSSVRKHSLFNPWKITRLEPIDKSPLQASLRGSPLPFKFQKRRARIDWRSLHTIDVEQIVRDTDIDKLESVLDTIAFGDIQGEDTRNFTETNFIKLYRLSQLMLEYLLHMQEILSAHKSQLLEAGSTLQKRGEKFRLRCIWLQEALEQSRRELKHTKKTLHTYESLLRFQGKASKDILQPQQQQPPKQAHHCPFCEKVFETVLYLDLHISRRHPKATDYLLEEKLTAVVSKAEESAAARVKAETATVLENEIQKIRTVAASQANSQRTDTASQAQVALIQTSLKENNDTLRDIQQQIDKLQSLMQDPKIHSKEKQDATKEKKSTIAQEKLKELELKFADFEHQIRNLGQENRNLLKELNAAYSEVSGLKSERKHITPTSSYHDDQLQDIHKEIQQLRKGLKKDIMRPMMELEPKPIKNWNLESEDHDDTRILNGYSRLALVKPANQESILQTEEKRLGLEAEINKDEELKVAENMDIEKYARIAAADAAVALAEAGDNIPADKEKWLRDHPFVPMPFLPHVLAKYPHSPVLFESKRGEVFRCLDRLLKEELKKFGISPTAQGISDAKYAMVAAALEKKRAFRHATATSSQKKTMEYERSTILWHIERAVLSRDMNIIESIFEGGTESLSGDEGNSVAPYVDYDEVSNWRGKAKEGEKVALTSGYNLKRSKSMQESEASTTPHRSQRGFSRECSPTDFECDSALQIFNNNNNDDDDEALLSFRTRVGSPLSSPTSPNKDKSESAEDEDEEEEERGTHELGDWNSENESGGKP